MIPECRGIKTNGNGWIYGFYVADVEWAKHYIYYPKRKVLYIQLTREEIIPETVGLCSGKTDKHGKTIYTGDILLITGISTVTVVWNKTTAGFDTEPYISYAD